MAATAGPEFMPESASGSGLGSSPRIAVLPATATSGDDSSIASPLPSPRLNSPPPNPPFVFPAKPAPSSAPSSYSRATGRRPRSAIEPQERPSQPAATNETRPRRSPQLPDFSFNPAATLPVSAESAFLSPPQSPQSPRAIPARPGGHGHRRGGSEFVGGKMRDGDAIAVMSTSPTKSEGSLASPVLAPSHPARGHRHKRSAAISSHDLSFMKIPPPTAASNTKAGSAPTSPAAFDRVENFTFPAIPPPDVVKTAEPPSAEPDNAAEHDAPSPPEAEESVKASPKALPRARVGFSDTLEFIPRPLSLVSSDTSSTVTVRPGGHSVSGSISSLISITTSTVADREPGAAAKQLDSRPSTAGAVLERTQSIQELEPPASSPRRRNSIPLLTGLPPPGPIAAAATSPVTPSPTKTPKRWSFFGLEPPFVGANSPTRSRPVSSSSSEPQPLAQAEPVPPPVQQSPVVPEIVTEAPAEVKPARKRSKKQKQVKKWAGSILSRKSKRHVKHKRRAPTPPLQRGSRNADEDEEEDVDLEASPLPTLLVTVSDRDGLIQRPVSAPDEDSAHNMIDLDAALGPFNTPLPRNLEWEAAQKAGGFVKKQLHSAAGMRGFSGPGMHYHRRAESAPEMQPFEGRFVRPFASSSTMADVFEEDEEDDEETKSTRDSTPLAATPVEKKEDPIASQGATPARRGSQGSNYSATERASPAAAGLKRKGSDLSEEGKPQGIFRMKSEHSSNSLQEEVIAEELMDRALPSISTTHAMGADSPAPSPRTSSFSKVRDLAPVQVGPLHMQNHSLGPSSPYSMTQSSIAQSPRSPMSPYDTHRISTAPSSITGDNTFESLLRGEPGPEVRVSVDIPSLASSNSTMTRDSVFTPNPQLRQPPLGDHPRPSSLTSAAFGRRRSSLASLSRLISSSHGERSKLSMEVPMEPDPEKKPKASKTKRLGRMMQFWKPKEQNA